MIRRILTGIKRFILWDYPRASWQYDIMVALILAFIFFTPREWFRDQPRIPGASRIARLQTGHGTEVFFIESELLEEVAPAERPRVAAEMLQQRAGVRRSPVRLEAIHDSENELRGYLAFIEP